MNNIRCLIAMGLGLVAMGLGLIFFLASSASAEGIHYQRVSRVIRVYDGDTLYVTIDGWPAIIGKNIGIRIRGIDTPEIRGGTKCTKAMARKARDALILIVKDTEVIPSVVYLENMIRGKYFRIVADVHANGYNVREHMISIGRAKAWDGKGKRPKWECNLTWFSVEEKGILELAE